MYCTGSRPVNTGHTGQSVVTKRGHNCERIESVSKKIVDTSFMANDVEYFSQTSKDVPSIWRKNIRELIQGIRKRDEN